MFSNSFIAGSGSYSSLFIESWEERVGSVFRKCYFRLSKCSTSFIKTLTRLIHQEVQCFSRWLDNILANSVTYAKSSLLQPGYLKKKWKSIAIFSSSTISSTSFINLPNPLFAEWNEPVPRSAKVVRYFSFSSLITRFLKAEFTLGLSIPRFSNNLRLRFCLAAKVFKWFTMSGAENLPTNEVSQYAITTSPDSNEKNLT